MQKSASIQPRTSLVKFDNDRWEVPARKKWFKNDIPVYRYFSNRYIGTKFTGRPDLRSSIYDPDCEGDCECNLPDCNGNGRRRGVTARDRRARRRTIVPQIVIGGAALSWKVRSARDRTIRTFQIRVRSKFSQNRGDFARIHQKSKNFRNHVQHFLQIFGLRICLKRVKFRKFFIKIWAEFNEND